MIPCFRNDADKPRNDWWVEKVLHMSFDITISFENLKAKYEKILNVGTMGIKILQIIFLSFKFKLRPSKNMYNIVKEMILNQ